MTFSLVLTCRLFAPRAYHARDSVVSNTSLLYRSIRVTGSGKWDAGFAPLATDCASIRIAGPHAARMANTITTLCPARVVDKGAGDLISAAEATARADALPGSP